MRLFFGECGYGVGFYRAGSSWVLCAKFPRFGLMHLGSPYWWKPWVLMPFALSIHLRAVFRKSVKA